ncbi:MAG: diguanylate cyclase [Chloroflexi bacterium]|nr:diguanylate cyclase [Chloroflexota bacterium]
MEATFQERLTVEAGRARRAERFLALLMVAVPEGQGSSDEDLAALAKAIREEIRVYDVAERVGSDVIAILLPEADSENAASVGRRVEKRLGRSLTMGVSTLPLPVSTPSGLVETATAALGIAKSAGGGIRVWETNLSKGPRGAVTGMHSPVDHVPYLADPSRLATPTLQKTVPATLLAEHNAVVVGTEGGVITIALPRPSSAAVDAISRATGLAVYPVYSSSADIEAARGRVAAGI